MILQDIDDSVINSQIVNVLHQKMTIFCVRARARLESLKN